MPDRRQTITIILVAPVVIFMVLVFVAPLTTLLRYSFYSFRGGQIIDVANFSNYIKLLQDDFFRWIILRTVLKALTTTLITVVLGYPLAASIVNAKAKWRPVLLILVLTPMLIGGVIRCYGWLLILDEHGALNSIALFLGMIAPVSTRIPCYQGILQGKL